LEFYRTLTGILKRRNPGCRVFLDADGDALSLALAGDILPDCIKPNEEEFSRWMGHELQSAGKMIDAARELNRRGLPLVVISRGSKGALYIKADEVISARGDTDKITSTVGAGDAMMAGIAAAFAEGADLERIARLSSAFALAKLGQEGPNLPSREIVEKLARSVKIEHITK
jgi:1-phosphofructokinase